MTSIQRLGEMAVESTIVAVQPLSTPPSTPATVTLTARNLGILVQWSKVPGSEGYNILLNSTADMSAPEFQVAVPGQDTVEWFYNTGHAATTKFIAVQSYKGGRYSDYTVPQSSTTTEAQAGSDFPANANFNDSEDQIATVTLNTTGGTLVVMGTAVMTQNGGDKAVLLSIKEDGALLRAQPGIARNDPVSNGFQVVAFNFSTPAAGSHTYTLWAQNTLDNATCLASGIGLIAYESPLLVMTTAAAPPSAPVTPQIPTKMPTGPETPFFGTW